MKAKKTINDDNSFIIVRHTYRNHLDELRDYAENIGSMHQFQSLLRWSPEKAEALGYPGDYHDKRHFNPRVSNIRLSIMVRGVETCLKGIDELACFLDSDPETARKLGYSSGSYTDHALRSH